MKEKRILEALGGVDELYIVEANPLACRKKSGFVSGWLVVAACLCLTICGGIGISLYNRSTSGQKKYYNMNLEEVSSLYEGVLLAENLLYDEANNTKIQLCYTGEGLPVNVEEWESLSVSADYEDYELIMDCTFNGEKADFQEEDIIEKIDFEETTVYLYQAEPQADYDLSYYAVFEYENILYELRTYTNDEHRIYDILKTVLGEPDSKSADSTENEFSDILGYEDYYIKVDEVSPGFIIQKYFANIDGADKCIAQIYGYVVPGPEVFSKDLDGDGINEFICNSMAGTGAARVSIFKNNHGVIEEGRLVYDAWDNTLFKGIVNQSSSAIAEKYIPKNDTFEVTYYTEDGTASVIFQGLEAVEFQEFAEEL